MKYKTFSAYFNEILAASDSHDNIVLKAIHDEIKNGAIETGSTKKEITNYYKILSEAALRYELLWSAKEISDKVYQKYKYNITKMRMRFDGCDYEEHCPFCNIEMQVHDYFNGEIHGYDNNLCCLGCSFIKKQKDYGFSPNKPIFKPLIHYEKKNSVRFLEMKHLKTQMF